MGDDHNGIINGIRMNSIHLSTGPALIYTNSCWSIFIYSFIFFQKGKDNDLAEGNIRKFLLDPEERPVDVQSILLLKSRAMRTVLHLT